MKEKCGGCELVEKNKNNNIECSRDEQLQKVEQKATNSRGSACLARPKSGGRVQFSRGRWDSGVDYKSEERKGKAGYRCSYLSPCLSLLFLSPFLHLSLSSSISPLSLSLPPFLFPLSLFLLFSRSSALSHPISLFLSSPLSSTLFLSSLSVFPLSLTPVSSLLLLSHPHTLVSSLSIPPFSRPLFYPPLLTLSF